MNASIHVFEDGFIRESICAEVQADIHKHLELNHDENWHGQFCWHSKWNIGDAGKRINSDALYNEALDYCLNQAITGLACFDFVLQHCKNTQVLAVTDEHIARVFDGVLPNGITKSEFDTHPGLLLAFAIAKNADADVDIYLCTSNGKARIQAVNALKGFANGVVVESFGDSVLSAGNESSLADDLKPLVNKFIDERAPEAILKDLFWPNESLAWFKKGEVEAKVSGDVPHNFDDFKELYKENNSRNSSPLGIYLRRIAGFAKAERSVFADADWFDVLSTVDKQEIESMVEVWLTNENTYRTIELFVGHHSMLGNGSERPRISAFAIPLLAALGPKPCCSHIARQLEAKFAWIDKVPDGGKWNFDRGDKDATKNVLVKAYLLFKELVSGFSDAFVQTGAQFDFLFLKLGINPIIRSKMNGTPPPRHPLLTLTQFRADEQDSGTMSAYNAFQDACKPKDSAQDRALFSWILPGEAACETILKIGVAKRD